MTSKLTLGKKIALGFALVILLAVLLGGIAVGINVSIRAKARMLAEEYIKEVAVANNVERHSLLTM